MDSSTTHTDKVYHRQFSPDSGESLALVARHISAGCHVLDVGCGAGDLGAYLRAEKSCTVMGVDYSADSVAVAAEKLDSVQQLDLNNQRLSEHIDETFDVIIMADILEHIYTPEQTLRDAEKRLKPDGKIIISIPNAGYVGALISLYDDAWRYREEGILDRTHIRFYTKQSVMELLKDSGFDGIVCDRVTRDLLDSEFTQRIDCQAEAVRDWLLAKPEGSTYQFIVEARPQGQQYDFPDEAPVLPMSMQHIVKCYWQSNHKIAFDDKQHLIERGEMGKSNTLRFAVGEAKIEKIRLDFADRRGVYQISAVCVMDGERSLWRSACDDYQLTMYNAFSAENALPLSAMAHDNQAHIELLFDKAVQGEYLQIIVTLNAPIGEHNIAFVDAVSLSQYQNAMAEQQRLATELARVHAESGAYITKLEETLAHERRIMANEQQQFAIEKAKLSTMHTQEKQCFQREIEQQQQKALTQQQAFDAQIQQQQTDIESHQRTINELLQSSSWKLTAPLRKLIHLVK